MAKRRRIMTEAGAHRLALSVLNACAKVDAAGSREITRSCEVSTDYAERALVRALERGSARGARKQVRRLLKIKASAERLQQDVQEIRRIFRR